ncbi:hypothetical protein BJ508DRAFT_312904 [Ascobolus immersus RN42]|uniref:Uncharacterized protein n=1 Tax=Ascobolus immersus RN42 TaxID=1160509 RepID=A0A3N4HN83_ASCIM|nr:hypothetical protein BJ508DRAFT_312904 [Ascobolus immersus RN42]
MDSPYFNENQNATRRSHARHHRSSDVASSSPHSNAPEHSIHSHEGYNSHPRHSHVARQLSSVSHRPSSARHSFAHTSITDNTDSNSNPSLDYSPQTATTHSYEANSSRPTSRADTIDTKERRVRLSDGDIRTEYMVWYCCQGSHMQLLINSEVCLWTNGDSICGHQFCEDCTTGWSS